MEPANFQQNKRLRLDDESAGIDHVPPRLDKETENEHNAGPGYDDQGSLEPEGVEKSEAATDLERAEDKDCEAKEHKHQDDDEEGRSNGARDESEEDNDNDNDKLPLSETHTDTNATTTGTGTINSPRFDFFDGSSHNIFFSEGLSLKRWNCRICTTDNLETRKECEWCSSSYNQGFEGDSLKDSKWRDLRYQRVVDCAKDSTIQTESSQALQENMTGLSFDVRMLLHYEPSSGDSGADGGDGSGSGGIRREGEGEGGEPAENFATKFPNSLESETDPPAADTFNESLQEAGGEEEEEDKNMEESQADFTPSDRCAPLHPERPDRLRAIVCKLENQKLIERCAIVPAVTASDEEISWCHSEEHIQVIDSTSKPESDNFLPYKQPLDTYVNRHSSMAARLAAGASASMMRAILSGQLKNGFAFVRPPGHHAECRSCMGFCLYNNAAIAAKQALKMGARRVLILDWDVHHGNGTQDIFEDSSEVLLVSLHRFEHGTFYPGMAGSPSRVGRGAGEFYTVNIGWQERGVGDADYLHAFHHLVMPIAYEYSPDAVVISAGFDAAMGDPLGRCNVTPAGYAHMTSMLMGLAKGRVMAILEGGYNLDSISNSAEAVVRVLMGESPPQLVPQRPSYTGEQAVLETMRVHCQAWHSLQIFRSMQRSFSERPGAGVENIVGGTLDSLFRVGDVRPPSEGSGSGYESSDDEDGDEEDIEVAPSIEENHHIDNSSSLAHNGLLQGNAPAPHGSHHQQSLSHEHPELNEDDDDYF